MEKNSHPSRQSKAPTPAQAKSALKKLQLKRPTGHRYHVKAKKTKQQQMIDAMEHARLEEYAMYLNKPWRLLGMNFLIGLARGLGMTIGLALVLALFVFVAQDHLRQSARHQQMARRSAGTRAKLFRNRTAIQRLNQ